MRRIALAGVVAALAGCAADCTNQNWQERGYRDGFGGHPDQALRLRQCAGFAEPDYLRGWAVGHDEHDRLKTMNDL